MKILIPYEFKDWNKYIDIERSNKYWANNYKQQESKVVSKYANGLKYEGEYPVKITVTKFFDSKRKDLDNVRIKGVLDGLVKCGVIKNDNLNHIQEIVLKAEFSKTQKGLEIDIEKIG